MFELRPDYRALLLAVDGLEPGPSDTESEALLQPSDDRRTADVAPNVPVEELAHVAAWRDAYRAFGAKPQRTRNSLEALMRRAQTSGLPRVNRLTDIYNAVSVIHQVPVGGEDLPRYAGAPRLLRASGAEPFDTVADGADWGGRAPRARRGRVVRRGRRHLPTVELAAGAPYAAAGRHDNGVVHRRRPRADDRRVAPGRC